MSWPTPEPASHASTAQDWMGGSSPAMTWVGWSGGTRNPHYIRASVWELIAVMSFLLFLFVMYWLPTLVAVVRGAPSALGVAVVNFFFGWTIVGWIMALIWALAANTSPHVIVIENGRVVRS